MAAYMGKVIVSGSLVDIKYIENLIYEGTVIEITTSLITSLVAIAIYFYWLVIQAKAFRVVHGFGVLRTWVFGLMSFISLLLISAFFLLPMQTVFSKAFIE